MEHVIGMILTLALLYVGVGIQTYLDLLMHRPVRRGNAGLGLMLLLGKSFLWPLVLLDKVRVNGIMTRSETAAYNGEIVLAAGEINSSMRESQQARMEQMKQGLTCKQTKNRVKRKQKKRKKKR